jgi:hypothetical protein
LKTKRPVADGSGQEFDVVTNVELKFKIVEHCNAMVSKKLTVEAFRNGCCRGYGRSHPSPTKAGSIETPLFCSNEIERFEKGEKVIYYFEKKYYVTFLSLIFLNLEAQKTQLDYQVIFYSQLIINKIILSGKG